MPKTPFANHPVGRARMPALDNVSDALLVQRARAGNAVAFESLVKRYQQAVFASAFAVLADAHTAQDVAQETFLAAFRTLGKLKNADRPRPWLAGIARNLAVSALRQRKLQTVPLSKAPEPAGADPHATRDASATRADEVDHLRAALVELTDRQREIVCLRYFEGLAYREIAAALDVTVDVVQVTLFRAKKALARILRKKVGPGATTT